MKECCTALVGAIHVDVGMLVLCLVHQSNQTSHTPLVACWRVTRLRTSASVTGSPPGDLPHT
eukprot:1207100-Rhodomonas_salina.1